jgi:hypothetical protein
MQHGNMKVKFAFLSSINFNADVTTVLKICMIMILFMNLILRNSLVLYILVVRIYV